MDFSWTVACSISSAVATDVYIGKSIESKLPQLVASTGEKAGRLFLCTSTAMQPECSAAFVRLT